MSLAQKYPNEVKKILSKYPPEHKRSAVMPLLYLAQREEGYLTKAAMQDVARIVDINEPDVAAIVGFYNLYHKEKGGKYRMQVCTDLPCALRGADEFMNNLCQNLGIKVGETTADGKLTVEYAECLGACEHAPCMLAGERLYRQLDERAADEFVDAILTCRVDPERDFLVVQGGQGVGKEAAVNRGLEVFKTGQYEDSELLNSGWADGDWTGDGEFSSGDLVAAFQEGGYLAGPRVSGGAAAVAEPSGGFLACLALIGLRGRGLRTSRTQRRQSAFP